MLLTRVIPSYALCLTAVRRRYPIHHSGVCMSFDRKLIRLKQIMKTFSHSFLRSVNVPAVMVKSVSSMVFV